MTNALVLIEACSICYRVQRTYLGHRSRRRTPLVCADCQAAKETAERAGEDRRRATTSSQTRR